MDKKTWFHEYYLKHREGILERTSKYRKDHPEKNREYNRRSSIKNRKQRRYECLYHYSNGTLKCSCCGENIYKFLTLDHINNNGGEERRKLFGSNKMTGKFYAWLIQNNFPEGYQVLCMNCNWGKRMNNGICPHKEHQ